MTRCGRLFLWLERDDVFEALQIVIIPALIFVACLTIGPS